MKCSLILLVGSFFLIACGNKEEIDDKISARELVNIIDDSSFISFKKLADSAGYSIADSSHEPDGGILYVTTQPGIQGNILSVSLTKVYHIDLLHFSTYDKKLYKRLKEQIVKLGFRSIGMDLNPEAEDFEKFNILISAIEVPDGKPNSYEFILSRKN